MFDVKGADALWSVQLVGRQAQEIDTVVVNIDDQFSGKLCGVRVK